MGQGFRGSTIDNLLRSGQLTPLQRGVYARAGAQLTTAGVVASLQKMGSDLVVGGTSALELHGRTYYIRLSDSSTVGLHGCDPLQRWVNALGLSDRFRRHSTARLFGHLAVQPQDDAYGLRYPFIVIRPWGRWEVRISTIERALFEVLQEVPTKKSFEDAELLMQGLPDLSPLRLKRLLLRVRSVKTKRLFFWLAERQGFAWSKRIRSSDFDLGSGKRVLEKSGRLVAKYGITVPESMYGSEP